MFDLIKSPVADGATRGTNETRKEICFVGTGGIEPPAHYSIIIRLAHGAALRPDGGVAGHPLKNSIITKQLTQ